MDRRAPARLSELLNCGCGPHVRLVRDEYSRVFLGRCCARCGDELGARGGYAIEAVPAQPALDVTAIARGGHELVADATGERVRIAAGGEQS